jgi:hypothetical protein
MSDESSNLSPSARLQGLGGSARPDPPLRDDRRSRPPTSQRDPGERTISVAIGEITGDLTGRGNDGLSAGGRGFESCRSRNSRLRSLLIGHVMLPDRALATAGLYLLPRISRTGIPAESGSASEIPAGRMSGPNDRRSCRRKRKKGLFAGAFVLTHNSLSCDPRAHPACESRGRCELPGAGCAEGDPRATGAYVAS